MKVMILAVAPNIHTRRWVSAMAGRGVEIVLATQHPVPPGLYPDTVRIVLLPFRGMAGYALNALPLRRLYERERPDFLHVHYVGGCGTTAYLSGVQPSLMSVWGGDVYDVPRRTPVHGWLVRHTLARARRISSTSEVMARQVRALGIDRPITVIPFGVDTAAFRPNDAPSLRTRLVIGTVKTLQPKYGIDTLIEGFALACRDPAFLTRNPYLLIAGGGPYLGDYQLLAARLGLADRVGFAGGIEHEAVPAMLRRMDIYVAASRLDSESFGVAVVEASACGLPVVVSDAGGLPEVVADGETGLVIPRDNPAALADALLALSANPAACRAMGQAGRVRVKALFEWSRCVDQMLACYREMAALSHLRPQRGTTGRRRNKSGTASPLVRARN